jgi:hypothetical protein
VPHFARQRPDHSPPELLSNDELDLAINTLDRKLRSARRMFVVATATRYGAFAAATITGVWLMAFGPAPIVEFLQQRRTLVTTWDVFAWWFAGLALTSLGGALAVQAIRRRRRRAAGWKHRMQDVERRLADAIAEREARRTR